MICKPCAQGGDIATNIRDRSGPPVSVETLAGLQDTIRQYHSRCTAGVQGCGCQHRIVSREGIPGERMVPVPA